MNLQRDLATESSLSSPIPKLLGRRHSSTLSRLLLTTLLYSYLLISVLFLNPKNQSKQKSYTNLKPLQLKLSIVIMTSQNKNPNSPVSNIPEDEVESVKVIRSRQDLVEGRLDKRVLVGKLIAQKPSNKTGIKSSIRNLWRDYELTQISEVNNNILMFTFKTEQQAARALADGPWFVLGNLLSIQEMLPGKSVSEVKYHLVPIWMQVHGLPFGFFNIDSIRAIVERVGQVAVIEYPIIDGRVLRSFSRVRVVIDVSKPLWAGSWISLENDSKIWVVFKYENLQGLCFNCGLLGHEQRVCQLPKAMAPFDKQKPKFGLFLSVDTPKPLSLLINEGSSQSQHPKPKPNTNNTQTFNLNQAVFMGGSQDQFSEGQGSNESARCNRRTKDSEALAARRKKYCEGTEENRSVDREEMIANVVEGMWLGNCGTRGQDGGIIDLTSDTEMDLIMNQENTNAAPYYLNWSLVDSSPPRNANQAGKGKAPLLELGGPSRLFTSLSSPNNVDEAGNAFAISLPEEDSTQVSKELVKRLDKVSEQELIQTWNSRFHLKRSRDERNGLEEVENEMVRRKKFKRESWYDQEGNVICVAITSEFGNRTYILDEEGFPKLPPN